MPVVAIPVIVLVILGGHYWVWRRLVRDTTTSPRLRRLGAIAVAVLAALVIGANALTRALGPRGTEWIAWPGFVWMGLLLYLVIGLLVAEMLRPLAGLVWRWLDRRSGRDGGTDGDAEGSATEPTTAPPTTAPPAAADAPSAGATAPATPAPQPPAVRRRVFLARASALTVTAGALGTVGYGMTQALGAPRLLRVDIPLKRLPRALDGMRVAVVSDIHLGPLLGRAHTERVVRTVNRTSPDLVAIVGDLADGSADQLGHDAEPLRRLQSRHGSYFVTGNHDYYSGSRDWVDALAELDVRTLANTRTEIAHGSGALQLAGVNDLTGEQYDEGPDFTAALGDRDPDLPVVLLAHQPVQVRDAARHHVDLQLSGHTHGGQLWPGQAVVRAAGQGPTIAGLGKVDDTWLYVTRGAGFWGPPVRVGAPPDITVVRLRSTQA